MIKKIKITDIQKIIGKKKIKIGLVLGSGLGKAIPLKKKLEFEYNEIKGFYLPTVTGHSGKLLIGTFNNRMVAVLSGRTHFYENGKADTMRNPIKLLKDLGVEKLVITNASGSLRASRMAALAARCITTSYFLFVLKSPMSYGISYPSTSNPNSVKCSYT